MTNGILVEALHPFDDDMTIEQMMNWYSNEAIHRIHMNKEVFVQHYTNTLNNQIQRIWDKYNECTSSMIPDTNNENKCENTNHTNNNNNHNNSIRSLMIQQNKNHRFDTSNSVTSSTTGTSTVVKKETTVSTLTTNATIRVDITSGIYIGKVFYLKPTIRTACLIGRSTSKKFVQNGISVPKDLEVSTTHAKIEKTNDGKYSYTDIGSTNGTYMKETGQQIPYHVPIALPTDGTSMDFIMGATGLSITVL